MMLLEGACVRLVLFEVAGDASPFNVRYRTKTISLLYFRKGEKRFKKARGFKKAPNKRFKPRQNLNRHGTGPDVGEHTCPTFAGFLGTDFRTLGAPGAKPRLITCATVRYVSLFRIPFWEATTI